jgi:low temperature requirement protein LtrA
VKTTLAHIADPLDLISAVAMCGGLALYFAGHVAHRYRASRTWGRGRPVATVALLALIPVATVVPALVALALVAGVCAALIAYEAVRYSYARAWIRNRRGSFTMEEAERVAPRPGRNPDLADQE